MSRAPRASRRRAKPKRGHYLLRLFVVGDGANSKLAIANLRSLCEDHLDGRFTIETVDVEKNLAAAVRDNILITPALVLVAPLPRVTILGNLNDRQKVLLALRLLEGKS
ncbi:MAG TPA: circadian clock KaiB family protein [Tepidisphaeraceae bacterium]|jgi:circadian clock protein KaiB|nr:circadian clock KaiB family protein [Tepidisphaeraceae bacterium]HEV8604287.1 circadian clock KaiB family protein [Tepidisphaeraceae bacterium]